jgi:glycosyltransferase involved in cell wall biosynthesis
LSVGKYNILLSAYSCEPFRGTEPGTGWNVAFELASAGHDVYVITRPVGRAGIEAFLAQNPCPRLHFTYIDSPHLSLRFGAIRPIIECFSWQWSALAAARKLCDLVDINVVHHVTWSSLHVGSKMWGLHKPLVFGPVGGGQVTELRFLRYLRGGRLVEVVRSVLVRYFTGLVFSARSTVSHASLVLVANNETGAWARRLGAPCVEYMVDVGVPRSMLVDVDRPLRPAGALRILWVGRLVPRKAPLLALEALAKVDRNLDISCTILGDGPQGRYLPGWIKELGLGDRVNWRGQVDWDEAMRAYLDHDAFLFTSLRDTSGTQLIEAMAAGLPIVTLDHQGAGAAVPPEAGIKIPLTTAERTTTEIAHALERLANGPEIVARMGRAGRLCASELTWDRKAARLLELYPLAIAAFNGRH